MRAFVAIPIDEPVKDRLVQAVDPLRKAGADVRWVSRENLHVSLKFLGDIDEGQADRLRNLLRAERGSAIPLEIRGLGQFPPRGAPRVVWAGCRGSVTPLATAIERAAGTVGVPREERDFTAHVTLGRVKSAKNARALSDRIAAAADEPFGSQTVRAFVLYKSTLTPDGPIYEELETFALTS